MLPADVGAELSAAASEVEDALAEGDAARARAEAQELDAAVSAAIERGDVPPALRPELVRAVEALLASLPEPQPPPAPPAPEPDEEEKAEKEDENQDEDEDEQEGEDEDEKDKKKRDKDKGKDGGKGDD